jgi:LPXTG-motif cell wall-anchored protein
VPLARTGTSSIVPSVVVALLLVSTGLVLVKTQRRRIA